MSLANSGNDGCVAVTDMKSNAIFRQSWAGKRSSVKVLISNRLRWVFSLIERILLFDGVYLKKVMTMTSKLIKNSS